jgi:hypothetical protein
MLANAKLTKMLMVAAVAALAFQPAGAQNDKAKAGPGATAKVAAAADAKPTASDTLDRAKILRAMADALGMVRWSDIGAGNVHLPAIDVINTIEFRGSGTTYTSAQSNKMGNPGSAFKTEYHVALAYNPPAMRVEMTRTNPDGTNQGGGPQHSIQVVREKYAWNESEIGAGLVPGKGTATPAMAAVNERLLQLWILPYGVVKAALAAGDKTKISVENGATVITFPLMGQLGEVTVKATLDAKNFVSKVETQTDNSALRNMVTETEYSDYADHGEILTDVQSPGHIVQKQGGHPVLDIQLKMVDANNPFLIFPVPDAVKKASAQERPPR